MSLSDLTNPKAVFEALSEFDELGREGFLTRYGYGPARSYFVLHKGRRYDSKAIAGVAYGYQFPDAGPLRTADFSGGEATKRVLERMGFVVTRAEVPLEIGRKYWAIAVKPSRYRILEAVKSLEVDTITTRNRPLALGDRVVIWQTLDREGRRGVVGLAEVISPPRKISESGSPFWVDPPDAEKLEERVKVRYLYTPDLPIWLGDQRDNVVKNLRVARAHGGTIFHVKEEQWQALAEAAGMGSFDDSLAVLSDVELLELAATGQGRGLDAPARKAVEQYAMKLAAAHYDDQGYRVEDVSGNSPYDLRCRLGDAELHVEVKGTTGIGRSVLLTRNEVRHAREYYPNVALYVVAEIELDRSSGVPTASGGVTHIFEPWDVDLYRLEPVTYEWFLGS